MSNENEVSYSVPEWLMKTMIGFLKDVMNPTVAFSFSQEKMMKDILERDQMRAKALYGELLKCFSLLGN